MRPRSLDEFLKKARVPYTTFRHPPAFTALHGAQVSHVRGRCWAKTVVCFADAEAILAVVPAHYMVDLEGLRVIAGAAAMRLASPAEMTDLFPDCEEGAMPPFGDLYRLRVFLDQSLVGEPEMVFSAGTHVDCFQMNYADFRDVAHPVVGRVGHPRPDRRQAPRTPGS